MRKTATITIADEGRDKGKVFVLTEMPAARAEKWALRALLALSKSGVDIGDARGAGMAGIATLGLKALAGLDFADAEPLMDEMFECIAIRPDPKHPELVRPLVGEDDIEEVTTRIRLRAEVFTLHTGFSVAGSPSTSTSGKPAAASPNTSTSPDPSAPSSLPARRRSTS